MIAQAVISAFKRLDGVAFSYSVIPYLHNCLDDFQLVCGHSVVLNGTKAKENI